jgi:hypothetical protein
MAAPGRADEPDPHDDDSAAARESMDRRAHLVELRIQQAMRRGDFDDLPGAGKPLPTSATHDPDWWIRRKIERENLTGLGPPALTLRTEDAEMNARLDALGSERAVREHVDDFNRRVVEARRQLLGGPPVVTPTRDADAEVERWRVRRDARVRDAAERRVAEEDADAAARRDRRRHPLRAWAARRRG